MLKEISAISVFNLSGAGSWEGRAGDGAGAGAIGRRSARSGRVDVDPLFIEPQRVRVGNILNLR